MTITNQHLIVESTIFSIIILILQGYLMFLKVDIATYNQEYGVKLDEIEQYKKANALLYQEYLTITSLGYLYDKAISEGFRQAAYITLTPGRKLK